jgi:hypothetical protein
MGQVLVASYWVLGDPSPLVLRKFFKRCEISPDLGFRRSDGGDFEGVFCGRVLSSFEWWEYLG